MSMFIRKLIEAKSKDPINIHELEVTTAVSVLEFDLSKLVDNSALVSIIEQHRKEYPVSMQDYDTRTNVKAWHSDWKTHLINPNFGEFIDIIKSCLQNHFSELELADFWFNVYEDSGSAKRHKHGSLQISCVYFVECDEDSSPLVIDNNSKDRKAIIIIPKPGKLVVFPGYVYHSVKRRDTSNSKKRTSIAFNFQIKNGSFTEDQIEERKKLCRGTDV